MHSNRIPLNVAKSLYRAALSLKKVVIHDVKERGPK